MSLNYFTQFFASSFPLKNNILFTTSSDEVFPEALISEVAKFEKDNVPPVKRTFHIEKNSLGILSKLFPRDGIRDV